MLKCSYLWPPITSTISHCALVKPFWQQKFFNLTSTNGQVCVVDGPGGNLQSLSLLSVPFRFEIDPDFLKKQEKYCKTKSLEILETLQKPLFQNDWKYPDTTDLIVLLLDSTSTWGTTMVISRLSPLNRLCLWEEWRWFSTNSEIINWQH